MTVLAQVTAPLVSNAIDILKLYQAQYTQTDKLWGYFGTVSLAVLAFTIGSEKATKTIKEVIVIIFGYWAFCIGNYYALIKAQEQLNSFATHAMSMAKEAGIPIESLTPFESSDVSLFYGLVVAVVSIGITVTACAKRA